ncbi:MAG: HD-GYP domain-containing protein [Planctomycetota bacterium]|jgi:hypothetical protein
MNDRSDVLQVVATLRSAMGQSGDDTPAVTLGQLDALEGALSRILAEHSGMAEEVLRVYEQLGIVFEVSRRLPTVHDEAEVLRLFVDNLRPTYPGFQVTIVEFNAAGSPVIPGKGIELTPSVREALAKCCADRRVVVADCPECDQGADSPQSSPGPDRERRAVPFARVMCGPVCAGDTLVCALLLGHGPAENHKETGCSFDSSDMRLLDSLNMFCGDLIRNFRLLSELRQLSVDMVRSLISAIDQKDEYTSGHSTRVGQFARLLGQELGLDETALQMLEWSALLHDVGKIGIRDEVLKKPGKLTAEEFEHIKEHPVRSYHIVSEVPQLADALDGVLHHHEHWDGSGYPDGLAGEEIPLPARIIQVADVFDALTSTRSYRQAFDWTKALSILEEEAGKTVDPELCAVFTRLIRGMAEQDPHRLKRIMSLHRERAEPRVLARAALRRPMPAAPQDGRCVR